MTATAARSAPFSPRDFTKTIRLFSAYFWTAVAVVAVAAAGFVAVAAVALTGPRGDIQRSDSPVLAALIAYVALLVVVLITLFAVGRAANAWLDRRSRVGVLYNGVDVLRNPFGMPKEIRRLKRAGAKLADGGDYAAVRAAFFGANDLPPPPQTGTPQPFAAAGEDKSPASAEPVRDRDSTDPRAPSGPVSES